MSESVDWFSSDQDLTPMGNMENDDLWSRETIDRLTAYRRGEIQTVSLVDVLAKYKA